MIKIEIKKVNNNIDILKDNTTIESIEINNPQFNAKTIYEKIFKEIKNANDLEVVIVENEDKNFVRIANEFKNILTEINTNISKYIEENNK